MLSFVNDVSVVAAVSVIVAIHIRLCNSCCSCHQAKVNSDFLTTKGIEAKRNKFLGKISVTK